jgi:hypothetical protein
MSKLATLYDHNTLKTIYKNSKSNIDKQRTPLITGFFIWCQRAELNCRHYDFQSYALPTELLWRDSSRTIGTVRLGLSGGSDGT